MLDNKNRIDLILLGGGGHCESVIDVIESGTMYKIKGILDSYSVESEVLGYPVLGGDEKIPELVNNAHFLITVGQIKSYTIRKKLADLLKSYNAKLATIVSSRAYVSRHAKVEEGTIIMHDSILNANSKIGKHCIINTKTNIEHGVLIEDFCHIATCAVVNGDSIIKKGTFVGSNATISNGIMISENSIICAGKFVK